MASEAKLTKPTPNKAQTHVPRENKP
jgi:hypothetical protein